ncbi:MAG: hypothetical protein ACLRSL_04595 [Streptococcus sp.]
MIIGTATLVSRIGAGGLGSFILLGIDRNNASLILIGALSSAFLAIAFIFFQMDGKAKLRTILLLMVMVIGLGVSYIVFLPNRKKKTDITKVGPEPVPQPICTRF